MDINDDDNKASLQSCGCGCIGLQILTYFKIVNRHTIYYNGDYDNRHRPCKLKTYNVNVLLLPPRDGNPDYTTPTPTRAIQQYNICLFPWHDVLHLTTSQLGLAYHMHTL